MHSFATLARCHAPTFILGAFFFTWSARTYCLSDTNFAGAAS